MAEQTTIRNFDNYGGLKLTALDRDDLKSFTFGAIPMRLFKYEEKLSLTVEVWEEIQDFNDGKPTGSKFNRSFSLDFAATATEFSQFFEPIVQSFYQWLEISPEIYDLHSFDINLTNLQISATAVHKVNKTRTISDKTDSLEEFEQLKADYPELVRNYFYFARTYAKTHDENLAKFN